MTGEAGPRRTRAPRGASVRILTPFTPGEAAAVKAAAALANMEIGAWLRAQAIAALERNS